MKKLLATLALILLFSIGCEKETQLSDFVIGSWTSQELVLGDSPFGTFEAVIRLDAMYTLKFTLSDGSASISCPATGYSIDDAKNQIIIDEPDFDPNDGTTPTGKQTFDVTWSKESKIMTWIPLSGDDAPTLVWTRK